MALEQQMAAQRQTGEPATWWRAEVEGVLDGDGRVVSVKIARPSGRKRFDQEALAAVRRVLIQGGPPDEKEGVVTRWSVSAALAVAPPNSIGFGFDETGRMNPGATGLRKYFSGTYPLKQDVRTKVALLSVRAREK
jgi:TonB family protein